MQCYRAVKWNEIGSFIELQIDLECVMHSEVSQKDKNKYCILTHIYGIQKNVRDDFICKEEIEVQTQRTKIWIPKEKEMGWEELRDWTWHIYTIDTMH